MCKNLHKFIDVDNKGENGTHTGTTLCHPNTETQGISNSSKAVQAGEGSHCQFHTVGGVSGTYVIVRVD